MGIFDFNQAYAAYKQCRQRKHHTSNAQRYEVYLLDNLWATVQRLKEHAGQPAHAIFFIALKSKARRIHAADFADRVVHHDAAQLNYWQQQIEGFLQANTNQWPSNSLQPH